MALLEISDLRFAYPDGFHVGLEQLELEPGGTAAIVGVSGSGKSTLLECIGLLNLSFRAQRFTLCGQALDLTAPRAQLDALRVRCIGYMPQNSALLPFLSIRDNLLCQIRLVCGRNLTRGEDMDYLAQLQPYFAQLKMERLLGRMPHEISVGQRQRASFLKAIAARPQLLLIDEPTSSLDRHNAEQMFACIRDIAQAEGIGVVVVTHDLQGVREFAVCAYDEASGQFRLQSPAALLPPSAASPVQDASAAPAPAAAPPAPAAAPPAPAAAPPAPARTPAVQTPPPAPPASAPVPAAALAAAASAPAPASLPRGTPAPAAAPPAPARTPAVLTTSPAARASAPATAAALAAAASAPLPSPAAVTLAMRSPVVQPAAVLTQPPPAAPAAPAPATAPSAPAPSLRARRGGTQARPPAAAALPRQPPGPAGAAGAAAPPSQGGAAAPPDPPASG